MCVFLLQVSKIKQQIVEEKRKIEEEKKDQERNQLMNNLSQMKDAIKIPEPYDETRGTPTDPDILEKRNTIKSVKCLTLILCNYLRYTYNVYIDIMQSLIQTNLGTAEQYLFS